MRRRSVLYNPPFMQALADLFALNVSFFLYQTIRVLMFGQDVLRFSITDTFLVGGTVTIGWMVVFWFSGLYRNYYVRSPFEEAFTILRVVFIASLLFFIVIYADSPEHYQRSPRFVFIVYWLLVSMCVVAGRGVVRVVQSMLRERGIIRIPTILVGSADRVQGLLNDLRNEPAWGYHVLGMVTVDGTENPALQNLGPVESLENILHKHRPDEVLITIEHSNHDNLLRIASVASNAGCKVKIVPDMYEIVSGQVRTQQIYGAPLIHVNPELMKPWEAAAKRLLDIVVSSVVLIGGLPLWLCIAIMVKVTSPGPIFFSQTRVGRGGQHFQMLKFRSMYVQEVPEERWTSKNDPRVTPFGRFIRKSHLDEVPQFWNVLRGEMSLVGPRPEQPGFVKKFSELMPYYSRRLKVKPGITGWWQVKAQSNPESKEEIESRLRYDFFYIENVSFMLDLEILMRTVVVMLRGHGRA